MQEAVGTHTAAHTNTHRQDVHRHTNTFSFMRAGKRSWLGYFAHLVIREHIVRNRCCFRPKVASDRAPVVVYSKTGAGEPTTCDAAAVRFVRPSTTNQSLHFIG